MFGAALGTQCEEPSFVESAARAPGERNFD